MLEHRLRPGINPLREFMTDSVFILACVLYGIVGISGYDETVGEADALGWYALIIGKRNAWIVKEDNQGFFDYTHYDDIEEARTEWDRIEEGCRELYDIWQDRNWRKE